MKRAILIFAAGQGTRIKSSLPKVLHTIAHKSMLHYTVDLASSLDPAQIVIICSPYLKKYLEENASKLGFDLSKITLTIQDPPKGTGHATQVGLDALEEDIEEVVILYADVPLIQKDTLAPLIQNRSDLCFVSMRVTPPHAYGRLVVDGQNIKKIVELKDATTEEQEIDLVWTGVLKANVACLKKHLARISPSPNTGEILLTSIASLASTDGKKVTHLEITDPDEFEGVNDKKALSIMESRKQTELRGKFLEKGVKIIAPETVFFADDTQIEADATIHPFVTFGKGVVLHERAVIHSFCHIEDSVIDSEASIGPFAHLRGHNHIGEKAAIGNFVEVKKSTFGKKAKAKHLAYMGDAEIGDGANIGAGTITCNYDGKNKHKTVIGARSFIGVNTTLVAPVTIGEDSLVGAGSVITSNVPARTLALGRARQIIKEQKNRA